MRRDDVRRTLIAYDVPDDRRRTRLAKALSTFGDRVQYSVFVVDISPAKLIKLRAEMAEIIASKEDSVMICDLGRVAELNEKRFSYLGVERPITENDMLVF